MSNKFLNTPKRYGTVGNVLFSNVMTIQCLTASFMSQGSMYTQIIEHMRKCISETGHFACLSRIGERSTSITLEIQLRKYSRIF